MSRTASFSPGSYASILPMIVACVPPRSSVKPTAQLPPSRRPTSAPSHHQDRSSPTRVNASNASEALVSIDTERTMGDLIGTMVTRRRRCIFVSYTARPMSSVRSLEDVSAAMGVAIRDAVERLWGASLERLVLERPPSLTLGDLASPVAFDLAKSFRKAPRTIATEIASAIVLPPGVREGRVEGAGYLNFFLDRAGLVESLLVAEPAPPARPGKIVVEHTNINPNK